SVGLGPVAAPPKGALVIAPSMDCHSHSMPTRSSYAVSPASHSRRKNPAASHSRNRLYTVVELPISRGRAFHWRPVRRMYTIAVNICRSDRRGRPPLGCAGAGGDHGLDALP